ncbi:GDSL-type esterase/lipase family protein, partial [Micromonospora zhanjiangensis]
LALASCARNSWSTGDGPRVNSLYRRLRAARPNASISTRNEASPGARAAALPDQAAAAVRAGADYVTVLIGANDACRGGIDAMTEVAAFRADVDRALAVLKQGRPTARLLMVSVPDLNRLWEAGHGNAVTARVWSRGVCPALLANPTSTAEADVRRRARFADRVDAYNDQIAAACRAYGSRCRSDGGAVHRTAVGLDLVNSLDFFHPNVAGQNRLAEVAWSASGLSG